MRLRDGDRDAGRRQERVLPARRASVHRLIWSLHRDRRHARRHRRASAFVLRTPGRTSMRSPHLRRGAAAGAERRRRARRGRQKDPLVKWIATPERVGRLTDRPAVHPTRTVIRETLAQYPRVYWAFQRPAWGGARAAVIPECSLSDAGRASTRRLTDIIPALFSIVATLLLHLTAACCRALSLGAAPTLPRSRCRALRRCRCSLRRRRLLAVTSLRWCQGAQYCVAWRGCEEPTSGGPAPGAPLSAQQLAAACMLVSLCR